MPEMITVAYEIRAYFPLKNIHFTPVHLETYPWELKLTQ